LLSASRGNLGLEPDWLFAGDDFCVQALRMESASASASMSELVEVALDLGAGK